MRMRHHESVYQEINQLEYKLKSYFNVKKQGYNVLGDEGEIVQRPFNNNLPLQL